MMQKLPIGISSFSEIRKADYVYVDKTALIERLVANGRYYFLSRPRRFGKSLLVDTLKSLFEGDEALFRGLAIHSRWDWKNPYPVINMTFNDGVYSNHEQLEQRIQQQLQQQAQRLNITLPSSNDSAFLFAYLIEQVKQTHQQAVVVLIDEYDKPILDQIHHAEQAVALRDGLKNLYSVLKGRDALLRFVLLTGVSKFSHVSLFSGLNNLNDITLDSRYSALCGYTQQDLEQHFDTHLGDANKTQIRQWYNGYNWLGESVYNPFDILLFIDKGLQFRSYWFETATPSFLMTLLKSGNYYLPDLEHFEIQESGLSSMDVDNIPIEVLLFQTGYLTIQNTVQIGNQLGFVLGYPNLEVKLSLTIHLLNHLTPTNSRAALISLQLYRHLANEKLELMRDLLKRFFASIPHQWYRNNHIDQYEGYYASVFYAHMVASGATTIPEDVTSQGQIDLTVMVDDLVFIFEFKVIDAEQGNGSALAQIQTRHYAEKYQDGRKLYLVGIEFSKQTRNIVGFAWVNEMPS